MFYDVIVAGARCAGASTAMLLARAGLRVLVIDPLPRGRDTLSTHALMRAGVVQLHRWGLLDSVRDTGAPPIGTTVFDYGDEVVPIPIKARDGIDALYAPRRTALDPILAGAAEAAGATVVHGMAVLDLVRDTKGRVRGAVIGGANTPARTVNADWVVGADGIRSRVARLVDAPTIHEAEHATASIYGYWENILDTDYRWYFRPGIGIGTIPTNDNAVCVFASMSPDEFAETRKDGLAAPFRRAISSVDPELCHRLERSAEIDRLRGWAGMKGFLRRASGPGWALVGDAGYFRDPLTAHGITDAFRDAELLARALDQGTDVAVEGYQETRDTVARGLMRVTDRIASLQWDMEEVRALHLELSREMNVGLEVIRGFDDLSPRPAPGSARPARAASHA